MHFNAYRSGTHNKFRAVYRRDFAYQVDNLLRANPIVLHQRLSRCYNSRVYKLREGKLRRFRWHAKCEHIGVCYKRDVRPLSP